MRRRVGLIAVAAALLCAQLPASAVATPSSSVLAWVERSVCGAPAPGRASCNALQLVQTRVARAQVDRLPHHGQRATPAFTRGPAGGYTPAVLASVYGVNPDATAAGSLVVAIDDACTDTKITNDLNMFDSNYLLPAESDATFRVVQSAGASTCTSADTQGWSAETSLDVEAVRGICHLCKILLVEAPSANEAQLGHAEDVAAAYQWDNGGTILKVAAISNSYGAVENSGSLPSDFASHYVHSGIAIIASTGDDGWYGWDFVNAHQAGDGLPQVPASLGSVVAVGGTTLSVHDNGTRGAETVWDSDGSYDTQGSAAGKPLGASGGGCSTRHRAPRFQYSVANYVSLGCNTGMRSATDIAAVADPYTGYDVYDSDVGLLSAKWRTFGGTSLAAPLIAGMWALAGGTGGITYPALSLYGHFKSGTSAIYDVLHGGNAFCGAGLLTTCETKWGGNPNVVVGGPVDCGFNWGTHHITGIYQCRARTGYDGPSGIGTPIGVNAFKVMRPNAVISVPSSIVHRTIVTFSGAHSTDPYPGGTLTTYHWNYGDGSSGTTSSSTVTHSFAKAGTYKLSLIVTDNYGLKSLLRTVSIKVT